MKARKGIRISLNGGGSPGRGGTGSGRIIGPNGLRFGSTRSVCRIIRAGGQRLAAVANPGVSVITCTNRPESLDNVLANYLRQNYAQKELIIVLNSEHINAQEWRAMVHGHPDIRVFQLDGNYTLGECLNYGIEQAGYEYVAKFDDDDYYGAAYLANAMPLFSASGAQIVGKCSMFVYFEGSRTLAIALAGNENMAVAGVAGATMIINKSVFNQVKFRNTSTGEDSWFLQDCVEKGIGIFSGDRFNFVCIRHSETNRHTWQVDEEEYLKYCQVVAQTDDYISIITS